MGYLVRVAIEPPKASPGQPAAFMVKVPGGATPPTAGKAPGLNVMLLPSAGDIGKGAPVEPPVQPERATPEKLAILLPMGLKAIPPGLVTVNMSDEPGAAEPKLSARMVTLVIILVLKFMVMEKLELVMASLSTLPKSVPEIMAVVTGGGTYPPFR